MRGGGNRCALWVVHERIVCDSLEEAVRHVVERVPAIRRCRCHIEVLADGSRIDWPEIGTIYRALQP